jgi:hypothetical protein
MLGFTLALSLKENFVIKRKTAICQKIDNHTMFLNYINKAAILWNAGYFVSDYLN